MSLEMVPPPTEPEREPDENLVSLSDVLAQKDAELRAAIDSGTIEEKLNAILDTMTLTLGILTAFSEQAIPVIDGLANSPIVKMLGVKVAKGNER